MLYWLNVGKGVITSSSETGSTKFWNGDDINWQYVPTRDNPADLGSRGGLLNKISEIWWKDLSWLQVKENWPRQPDIKPSVESEKEVKISKEHKYIFFIANEIRDDFDLILHKFDLRKALRV